MNERIEGYLRQYHCYRYFDKHGETVIDPHYFMYREEVDGLIELIVRECVDVVLAPHNEAMMSVSMDLCKFSTREAINRAAQSGGLKVHTRGIANQIRQHFGVGE